MQDSIDNLIRKFRKKIYFTSVIGIILSILVIVIAFFIEWSGFQENWLSFLGIGIIVIVYLLTRTITYQEILEGSSEQVILKLEEHLEDQDQKSKKYNWIKIFLICFVALGWIIRLINHTKTYLTFLLFGIFVFGILYIILEKWMRLTAAFMLQDLKHCMRELIHESPETPAGQ